MAGGWARDGAVNDRIAASIAEETERLRARTGPVGESTMGCVDCGDPIPEERRAALSGVKLCIHCQQDRDGAYRARPGISRRGSQDRQLK